MKSSVTIWLRISKNASATNVRTSHRVSLFAVFSACMIVVSVARTVWFRLVVVRTVRHFLGGGSQREICCMHRELVSTCYGFLVDSNELVRRQPLARVEGQVFMSGGHVLLLILKEPEVNFRGVYCLSLHASRVKQIARMAACREKG
eukprot:6490979-Amphidinium_carterae.1